MCSASSWIGDRESTDASERVFLVLNIGLSMALVDSQGLKLLTLLTDSALTRSLSSSTGLTGFLGGDYFFFASLKADAVVFFMSLTAERSDFDVL